MRTGKPILYTSADSVLQIAAHETHFGLDRLYRLCEIARAVLDRTMPDAVIGRVIARPFIGETQAGFERTGNRKDYAVLPPEPTLLDRLKAAGRAVIAVGKIDDIFAHQGPTDVRKANGNADLLEATLGAIGDLAEMAALSSPISSISTSSTATAGTSRAMPPRWRHSTATCRA